MTDLIDRQAAMNAINAYGWLSIDGKARCREVLTALPTIQAEPVRHGHWIRHLEQKNIFGRITLIMPYRFQAEMRNALFT